MALEETEDSDRNFLSRVTAQLYTPVALLTSPTSRIIYLHILLLLLAAIIAAITAVAAYAAFYYNFIPRLALTLPIYLQYSPTLHTAHQHSHPYGTVDLSASALLTSQVPYDISLRFRLPRTPSNVAAGNFMLDLSVLGQTPDNITPKAKSTAPAPAPTLAHARRPAIMTYVSPIVDHAHKAIVLPAYVVGFKREEETLEVRMLEGFTFARGWRNIPASVRVELQSQGDALQVYSAECVFVARFGGVRWLMYQHRVASFAIFTTAFWCVEMGVAIALWAAFTYFSPLGDALGGDDATPDGQRLKKENDETSAEDTGFSDTDRTFPTYSTQPALRYTSPIIKREEVEEEMVSPALTSHPIAAEADDEEDEDADFILDPRAIGGRSDSGLGTSMESSAGESVRRRSNKLFGGASG